MLEVFLHGRRVGALRRKPESGSLQFRYDADYVDEGGPPLSQNMPLRKEAYPPRDCLAFFANLLPEEDVRTQVALATGISATNDYRLLERFGGDVAGAVTLLPSEGEARATEPGTLEVLSEERLDELLTQLPQRPLGADEKGEVRLSLAGAQNKVPVVETGGGFGLPHGSRVPTTHILKPEPANLPGLVENEFFCMRLAAEAGLPVANVEKARTGSGLPFLIVTRYDRDMATEPIRRLHQEDLCQALGRLQSEKYQEEGGPTVREAMELIAEASAVPARDRPQLWSALVFNALVGNCDSHGKNYSLLYDSSAPSLAPLYDLVSTAVYPGLSTRLAMSIDGAKRLDELNPDAWRKLASEIGFAPRYVDERVPPLVERVLAAADSLASRPEHDAEVVAEIRSGIHKRASMMPSRA
ncbi:MAG TPA: type II toxin-antitoxin system HipA family toxin [Thermoleophilaceae bacterium]